MSFSRNYNCKPEFIEKRLNGDKKMVCEENPSKLELSSREVYPQFSEPDEYSFDSKFGSSSFNYGTIQHNETRAVNKTNTIYNRPVSVNSRSMQSLTSSNKNFPTFRQYSVEQIKEKDGYFEENLAKRKFSLALEGTSNESELCDPSIISNKGKRGFSKICENIEANRQKGSIQQKNQKGFIGMRARYLVGTVDQVIRWYKMVKNMEIELLYEMAGLLERKKRKDCMELLFIRSESGRILQGVFYNIDRELPDLQLGKMITATGSMIGSNKLQIFDAGEINKDDFISIQRLAFLGQRSLQEALGAPICQ